MDFLGMIFILGFIGFIIYMINERTGFIDKLLNADTGIVKKVFSKIQSIGSSIHIVWNKK